MNLSGNYPNETFIDSLPILGRWQVSRIFPGIVVLLLLPLGWWCYAQGVVLLIPGFFCLRLGAGRLLWILVFPCDYLNNLVALIAGAIE